MNDVTDVLEEGSGQRSNQSETPKRTNKLMRICQEEFGNLHFRYLLIQGVVSILPYQSMNRLRAFIYRVGGLSIGGGSTILGKMTLTGGRQMLRRLKIGKNCVINSPIHLDVNAKIDIGDHVVIGHHVILITSNHEIGQRDHRAGSLEGQSVTIENGVWIGACATILPGVTIGQGSVVAAGSIVVHSVPADKLVAGVPAKIVKDLAT